MGFSGNSVVKNLPAMQETQVQSLGWEAPLEKEMATHSSILAWKILWTEEPGRLQSMESQELDMTEYTHEVWGPGNALYYLCIFFSVNLKVFKNKSFIFFSIYLFILR